MKRLLLILFFFLFLIFLSKDNATISQFDISSENIQVKSITEEEYLQRKALYENKSLTSTTNEHYSQKNRRSTVSDVFKEYSYTQTYPSNSNFKATVVATYHLQGSGNYYDIVDCTGVYSKIAEGIGESSWTPGSTSVKILSSSNSYITANGYYQTTVNRLALNNNIPDFSIIGTNFFYSTYVSNNVNLSKSISANDIKYKT